MKDNIKREFIKVTGEEFGDFTGYGPWEVKGEKYYKVTEINTSHMSDGESWDVIIQRESDDKFFKFNWWEGGNDGYVFCDGEDGIEEVFAKTKRATIYE